MFGGVAVNLYGFMRMTMDLDLLASSERQNRSRLCGALKRMGFRAKSNDLVDKFMLENCPLKGLTFFRADLEIIDVHLQSPADFEDVFRARKIFKSGDVEIPAIPYDVLVSMKRETGRERDLIDIGYLELIKKKLRKGEK